MNEVSIIIAVYNGAEFIEQTINSLLSQTFSDFEIIVVINCSDDETLNIVKKINDTRIKIYETEICQLAFNLNFGLNVSNGKYIMRIDADDIAMPRRLEKQLEVIKNSNYDIVGSNLVYIDENSNIIGSKKYPEHNAEIRKGIYFKSNLAHPSVMYKKDVILRNSGYMNGKSSEDYDLWIRLMRNKSIQFYNIQEDLTYYRIHSNQAKGNKYAYAEIAGYFLREAISQKSIKAFFGSLFYIIKTIVK